MNKLLYYIFKLKDNKSVCYQDNEHECYEDNEHECYEDNERVRCNKKRNVTKSVCSSKTLLGYIVLQWERFDVLSSTCLGM